MGVFVHLRPLYVAPHACFCPSPLACVRVGVCAPLSPLPLSCAAYGDTERYRGAFTRLRIFTHFSDITKRLRLRISLPLVTTSSGFGIASTLHVVGRLLFALLAFTRLRIFTHFSDILP